MRKTGAILLALMLATFAGAFRLPAASCILSNAPSHEACKMDCCANKTCCAVSKKSTAPASQPLVQMDAATQLLGLVATVPSVRDVNFSRTAPISCAGHAARAHSPPPLAATC